MVATPIGNLEDITLRALRVLKEVNLIACEDTRRTKKLLERHLIRTPLVSYHQHSRTDKIDWLVEQLASGMDVAVVSDAGTPAIQDPGGTLVSAVLKANQHLRAVNKPEIVVTPIPGANAGISLLSVAGIATDHFLFVGYLPKKKGRQTQLRWLADFLTQRAWPIVVYEAPQRITRTVTEMTAAFGPGMQLIVGRELTKQFEEVWRGTLAQAVKYWTEERGRGEFALIVTPKIEPDVDEQPED